MTKTSTFIYAIHNLASKAYHELIPTNNLVEDKEFASLRKKLDQIPLVDVRQEIVDNILNSIDDIQ